MKKALVSLIVAMGLVAPISATQLEPWQVELQEYQAGLPELSRFGLSMRLGLQSGMVLASCSADFLVVGASFIADTIPVVNGLSEGVANLVDPNYTTIDFESIFSLAALADTGRGIAGGAFAGIYEALEFVFLWLAGEENRSFEAVKKLYGSSVATTEALFAQKGKCVMSFSKVVLTGAELEKRQDPAEMEGLMSELLAP